MNCIDIFASFKLEVFGVLFIALLGFALINIEARLIPLIYLSSVMQAASVVNIKIGGAWQGVQPYYVIMPFFIFMIARQCRRYANNFLLSGFSIHQKILLSFIIYSFVATIVAPFVFNEIQVRPAYDAYSGVLINLKFGIHNVVQLLSLFFIFALFIWALDGGYRNRELVWIGVVIACVVVVVINLYEQFAYMKLVPSMKEYVSNNPSYYQAGVNPVSFNARVGLPFSEPSYASAFIAANALGCLFVLFFGRSKLIPSVGLIVLMIALASTGGGTGILTFIVGLILSLLYFIYTCTHNKNYLINRSIRAVGFLALIFFILIFSIAFLLGDVKTSAIPDIFSGIFVSKLNVNNSSTLMRLNADFHTLVVARESFYIGVGMGSIRASSFISTLFSSVGLIGFVLFFLFIGLVVRMYWRCLYKLCDRQLYLLVSMISLLFSFGVAIPDVGMPMLWVYIFAFYLWRPGELPGKSFSK